MSKYNKVDDKHPFAMASSCFAVVFVLIAGSLVYDYARLAIRDHGALEAMCQVHSFSSHQVGEVDCLDDVTVQFACTVQLSVTHSLSESILDNLDPFVLPMLSATEARKVLLKSRPVDERSQGVCSRGPRSRQKKEALQAEGCDAYLPDLQSSGSFPCSILPGSDEVVVLAIDSRELGAPFWILALTFVFVVAAAFLTFLAIVLNFFTHADQFDSKGDYPGRFERPVTRTADNTASSSAIGADRASAHEEYPPPPRATATTPADVSIMTSASSSSDLPSTMLASGCGIGSPR